MVMHNPAQQRRFNPTTPANQTNYSLKWRQNTLIIQRRPRSGGGVPIDRSQGTWAADCIRRSPVQRVKLDRQFNQAELAFWADACAEAGKSVYLSLPSVAQLPQRQKPWRWKTKCAIDRVTALIILTIISPLLLLLAGVIRRATTETIFVREWQVGARGRLYQAIYFRTSTPHGNCPYSHWMRHYHLDRLPKLINVLRGEMSLVGACPRRLSDVPDIEPALHNRLNSLPGITGTWHLASHLDLLDLSFLHRLDLQYVWNWSLLEDFKVLVMTASKMFAEVEL
jgi:lipopolysaccharide/colanic/teichoic acid biosynthesis glycosyltransferase